MSGKVGSITSKAQFEELNQSGKVVLIDCYADWCGPCRMISPIFEQHAKENADKEGVVFYKLNTDDVPDLAEELGIRALPTFHVYKAGERIDTTVGANPGTLKTFVQKGVSLL